MQGFRLVTGPLRIWIGGNEALYATVRDLARLLRKFGEDGAANDLEDAMLRGATSGEVLGDLRAALERLRTTRVYVSRWSVMRRTNAALSAINRALGPRD